MKRMFRTQMVPDSGTRLVSIDIAELMKIMNDKSLVISLRAPLTCVE